MCAWSQRTGARSSCWSGLLYAEALGPPPSTACLPTSCSPTTHQPSQSQWEQGRSSQDLSLRSSAPSVTNKRMMMGSPCDGNWELSQVCQSPVGGSGPAESCCAELPCQWDTACTTLPCHCPSREEAEELVLILLSNPFLPPCSCSVPSLHLWAIAPCSSWGWRQQGGDLHPQYEGYF